MAKKTRSLLIAVFLMAACFSLQSVWQKEAPCLHPFAELQLLRSSKAENVRSLAFTESSLTIAAGKSLKPAVNLEAEKGIKVKKYSWESSNPEVADVTAQGMIRGLKEGTAAVQCTAVLSDETTLSASINVQVYIPVKSLKINTENNVQVNVGKTKSLAYSVLPSDATTKKVIWQSKDESIATVDENGTITARSAGKTVITGTTAEGNKTARINIYVPSMNISADRLTVDKASGIDYTFDFYRPGSQADDVICKVSGKCFTAVPQKRGTKVTVKVIPTAAGEGTLTITDKKDSKCKLTVLVRVLDSAIPDSSKIVLESCKIDQYKDNYGRAGRVVKTRLNLTFRNDSNYIIDKLLLAADWRDESDNQIYLLQETESTYAPVGTLITYFSEVVYMPPGESDRINVSISYYDNDTYPVAKSIPAVSARFAIRGYHIVGHENNFFLPDSQLIWYNSKDKKAAMPVFHDNVVSPDDETIELAGQPCDLLGVDYRPVYSSHARSYLNSNYSGIYVIKLTPGGIAEKCGLQLKDVIYKINDIRWSDDFWMLARSLAKWNDGEALTLYVSRNGKLVELQIDPPGTAAPEPTATGSGKPSGEESATSEQEQSSAETAQNNDTNAEKTVVVPVGEYYIGEDIPAGTYTLHSEKYATIELYKDREGTRFNTSYTCEEPDFTIGKLTLPDGIMVRIKNAPLSFSPYKGLSARELMEANERAVIPVGMYVVGEDFPAGTYTLTSEEYATIALYSDREGTDFDTAYSCGEPDFTIGKLTLPDGIMVHIKNANMTFEPYKGLGF